MVISRLSCGLAWVLVLSGCHSLSGTGSAAFDTAKISAETMAAAHARIDALNAHDAAKNVSDDMADVVIMSHGAANEVGVAADMATTKALTADPLAHVDLSTETVDVGGPNFSVYRATYDLAMTNPTTKAPFHERGNLLIGFKREPDGALKVAWEIASDVPPPAKSGMH